METLHENYEIEIVMDGLIQPSMLVCTKILQFHLRMARKK